MRHIILPILLVLVNLTSAWADQVATEEIRALLEAKRCADARLRIQEADNRGVFLETAEGQAYYCGALCYSRPSELNDKDIDNAIGFAEKALVKLRSQDAGLADWVEKAKGNCNILKKQFLRKARDEQFRTFSGKMQGGCQDSPSGVLLQPQGDSKFEWDPIMPSLKTGFTPTQESELTLERASFLRKEHVTSTGVVKACAPFSVVSTDMVNADFLCRHAQGFFNYFKQHYKTKDPSTWLTIHHYSNRDGMKRHIAKHKGPQCTATLGYYDWRRQTIVILAAKGSAGTLQHELTHAFVFWDFPLAPRWLEEGLASLYENTDSKYVGLPNPWRENVLQKMGNPSITPDYFQRYLKMSALEFEHSSGPSTVSRKLMMKIQKCNNLNKLYTDVKMQDESPISTTMNPNKVQSDADVQKWYQAIQRTFCKND